MHALESAGVDNWDGYDFAMDFLADKITEPAGQGCGYGFDMTDQHDKYLLDILLRINKYTLREKK